MNFLQSMKTNKHILPLLILHFIQPSKAYTSIALIWNPLNTVGHVITIPWEAGLLRKQCPWVPLMATPLNDTCYQASKFGYLPSHLKGVTVATNGHEIFLLAFGMVPIVKWSFFALSDFHIFTFHVGTHAFWAYTELRRNSSQEDYVSSGHVFRAVRMLSSPQMGNTGGFLLIGFMIDKTNTASLNPSCIFMGWKKFREQVKKSKSFSRKIVLSFYLSWLLLTPSAPHSLTQGSWRINFPHLLKARVWEKSCSRYYFYLWILQISSGR